LYVTPTHELRYHLSLLPETANGSEMNWNVAKSNAHSLEYTRHYQFHGRKGAARIMLFFNTTNMGNYNQSIANNPTNPTTLSSREYGHTKYGAAINVEQEITPMLGCFFRASWNDGNNETWAFTEIDHSVSAGISLTGKKWKRENDVIGLANVSSGISTPHRDYLKHGGKAFMLGDGTLNYAWENLTEIFYKAELVPDKLFVSGAYQLLLNPGYNKDRHGPVNVFSVRVHARI
jgi:high affinity Mn2+ porin